VAPNVPINSATRPIGIGFVADLVRARRLGEPDNRVPLKSHPGHWCYRRAYLKQIEAPWSYRAERQGIENLRTNS